MTLSAAPRISCEVIDTRADRARIFNLQRYSLNDGQGIRTVVFLKAALIPARGAPIPNQFHLGFRPCAGRANACAAPAASRTLPNVHPERGNRLAAM